MINAFRGTYSFLSNMFTASVTYNGITYSNTEAAFQAQKCPQLAASFATLTGGEAKKMGRKVPMRPDWNSVKDQVMYEIVSAKFSQHPALKAKLLATGDQELVEGNTWRDYYWGVCNGQGQNKLGQILMRVRSELR